MHIYLYVNSGAGKGYSKVIFNPKMCLPEAKPKRTKKRGLPCQNKANKPDSTDRQTDNDTKKKGRLVEVGVKKDL